MDIIYTIMLVFMTGSFCVISFLVGTLSRKQNNRVNLNPIKSYKKHKEIKEQTKANDLKQRKLAVMLENINNYDGTSRGQKPIPND